MKYEYFYSIHMTIAPWHCAQGLRSVQMLKHTVSYKSVLLSNLSLVDWNILKLLEDNSLWWYNFDCSKMENQMLYSLEFETEKDEWHVVT